MSVFHDEVEIEDFEYDEDSETYTFPCPCGDKFTISKEELQSGEDVATCPSCSLIVRVVYDQELFVSGELVEAPPSTESKTELLRC
ncbi:diphthamide biosynthesis protein 3 [Clinocottus analis]|uniref:diphthamide biosynthesis protein 3 n=1 Tax=Clinocottus analis TaxID=304258 RepID=UPI0035C0C625